MSDNRNKSGGKSDRQAAKAPRKNILRRRAERRERRAVRGL